MRRPEPAHRYEALGLRIASALALPELARCAAPGEPQLTIRFGPVGRPSTAQGPLAVTGDATSLNAAPARFHVLEGREITIDPRPGATEADLRGFLLGPVLGIVCHQRGLIPLHASAIVAQGAAIAFAGPSGAGKSTLAAHFQARGYPVLCDDICAIDLGTGAPRVSPGVARLKLWPDSWERLGCPASVAGPGKRELTPRGGASSPAPLGRVYLLAAAAKDARIAPLGGTAAVEALIANVFRARYLAPMGLVGQAFSAVTTIARRVPVFALRRAGDLAELEREADRLERHFTLAAARAPA